jgi:drug/metabolite transporter (DMT)-like permease
LSPTIACALAALICYGLGDVIYKRAAGSGLGADQFLAGQAWIFCPALIAYAWATGTLAPTPAALWGSAAGLIILVGFYNFARSLQAGAVSVVAPVFRLNFLVTAGLAVAWLHEPLTVSKLAGSACALAAGWLLLGGAVPRGTTVPSITGRALARVLVATVATGVANFCYKLGLNGGATPETILVAQAVVFSGLATAMTYVRHGSIRLPQGFLRYSGPAALVLIAAFLFLLHGLKHGEASIVVPIAQMGFVVAALFGVLLLGEALTARKLAGLCAAGAALLLLAV